MNFTRASALVLSATALAVVVVACGGGGETASTLDVGGRASALAVQPDQSQRPPKSMDMTWFGITNWHYQIGTTGILLDGETRNQGSTPDAASVSKALASLKRNNGSIDVILVGHDHGDHSVQVPEWAKQTGKTVFAPPTVCTKLVNAGLPAAQCVPLLGGEKIAVDRHVDVHVVRWVHSVDCDELSNGTGGPETFGFLIAARTNKKDEVLNVFVSDSGAGGPDLTTPRVANGITYGSPLTNLAAALNAAGLSHLDIWQGGPESRMVYQARAVVPTFSVRTFMPHHLNARANAQGRFNLNYGMHYPYTLDDQPKLRDFLEAAGVPQVFPTNYFDKWNYSKDGIVKVDNSAAKADWGLPAEGPGPGVQGPNPRAGNLECTQD
jgi:hypothetical protein